MSSHFDRDARDYHRRRPREANSGKTILIVSEGVVTEPQYLVALRNHLRLHSTDVEIVHGGATDPVNIVDHALKLRKARQKAARKDRTVAYDEVWCVFDAEGPPRRENLARAVDRAKATGVFVALSHPCFEYWLVLHETYTTATFADYEAVKRRLREFHPEYDKHVPTDLLIPEKVPTAVTHARRVRIDHQRTGTTTPVTEMDLLVVSMNEATREHLRITIPDPAA